MGRQWGGSGAALSTCGDCVEDVDVRGGGAVRDVLVLGIALAHVAAEDAHLPSAREARALVVPD